MRAIRELEPGLQTAAAAEIARLDVEVPPRIDRAIAALVASRLGAPLRVRRSSVARLAGPLIGRNAPCPCGSGKKHKHCCGR